MHHLTISTDLDISPAGEDGKLSVFQRTSRKTYLLGKQESQTLQCFDGVKTTQEIGQLCPWYSDAQLQELIALFRKLGFFQEYPLKRKHNPLRLRLRLGNPNRLFSSDSRTTKLAARTVFLFCPLLLLAGLLLPLLHALGWPPTAALSEAISYFTRFRFYDILALLGLNCLLLGLHELGHAVVAKYYGVNVPEIGIMLYCLIPTAYTNVSGLHLLQQKRQKLLILLAGTLVNLGLIGISYILLYLSPGTVIGAYALASILLNFGTILFNCIVFLKFDGYYIAEILLDEPGFRENAMAYLRSRLALCGKKHKAEREAMRLSLQGDAEVRLHHTLYAVYAALALLCVPILAANSLLALL